MARTGTEFGRISGSYKTYNIGTYQLSSQDVANNKSFFKLRDYFTYEGGTQVTSSYSTFKLDGTTVKSGSYAYSSGDHQLGTKDISVQHNNDGSFPGRSVEIYVNSYHMSGTKSGKILSAPTIPRASSVTATEACVEAATTINIARASTNFRHTLKYSCGGLTGTIVEKTADATYGWIIPATFYEKMTGKEIECTIICETYNGTIKVGEKSTTFKVKVDESKCKPEVSATFKDVNAKTVVLTGNNQKLVKFISNVQIAMSATGKNGATIVSKSVACADGKSRTSDGTINSVESGKFTVSAVDSRNISSSKDYNLTMIEYIKLTCNANFYRPQPTTGEVAVKFDGNYFNSTFGQVANILHIFYRYRKKGTSSWSGWVELSKVINGNRYSNGSNPISLGTNFDYRESYEFQIKANDKIYTAEEVSSIKSVSAGIPVANWGKNNFDINVVLYLKNALGERVNIVDLFYPVGHIIFSVDSTNPGTTLGGTWVLWGKGRVPVGVDASQEEFKTAEKVGGEKNHKLTEAETFPHTHGRKSLVGSSWNFAGQDASNGPGNTTNGIISPAGDDGYYYPTSKSKATGSKDGIKVDASHEHESFGDGEPFNILQPYITCYMWKRTA